MYSPNDEIDVEIDGVGRVRTRLLTEEALQAFGRAMERKEGEKLTLPEHHAKVNAALAPYVVAPELKALTLAQKIKLAEDLPWAVTNAELEQLKNPSASPSGSPTK